ncbi:MAG TPA: cytochrome c oxidase subunit II [Gemmatimonadaceae bacterium]|nr:cytochrome c oxidase subunit II [Gemmatimonadaceae bacterium]
MSTERGARPARFSFALALAVACAALAGCNGTTSYMDATGMAGHEEATLGWWLTGVSCFVVLFVAVAVLWGIARHWGEHNEPGASETHTERVQIRSGLSWIYVGVAVSLAILLVTFGGTMVTLNAASHPPIEPSLVMDVTGHQWWWEIRYEDPKHPELDFVTANEVHLPVGQPVRVRLHSADVIHSFWLPQIAGKTDVIPGQTNEMWVEAKTPGVTRGECAEYCGMEHAFMDMPVVAESPADFNAWAQGRRAAAPAPVTPEQQAGEVVFTRSCGACHAIAGTNALGRYGPDLTHLASRPFIGAGVLANTPGNLMRWIEHAPDVKEGTRMPEIPLDGNELRDVVAYLQTLR